MNIEHYRRLLHGKEQELLKNIARLEQQARAIGQVEVRDETDAATSSQGSSELLQEEALESETLKQVRDALHRIEDGTYGKCRACGQPIEAARLEAVPWAAYCLEDQKKQDKAAHVEQGGSTL